MEPQMNADTRGLDRIEMNQLTKEVIRRADEFRKAKT